MSTKQTTSEAKVLENYRIALENAINQPEIATVLTDFGYDSEKISEGKALLDETRQIYNLNKTEDDETTEAYADFSNKKTELEQIYSLHRKKAKVIFRNDATTAQKLAITGSTPKTYVNWLENLNKFYSVASNDSVIKSQLIRLKITETEIDAAKTKLNELDIARTEYLKEIGESQAATKAKDAAFAKIDDWMSEFYAVARIGLEDNPQLLEALGKIVKS